MFRGAAIGHPPHGPLLEAPPSNAATTGISTAVRRAHQTGTTLQTLSGTMRPTQQSPTHPALTGSAAGSDGSERLEQRLRAGTDHDASLREQLIVTHMPVARAISTRYRARGIPEEDLRQVAYLALTKAAHRFDPEAGHVFLSFCVPTIRGEIRRYFRDHGWMVRPPRGLQELQQAAFRVEDDLAKKWGRPPAATEIAAELEAPLRDVLEALDARGAFSPTSLDRDAAPDGDGISIVDVLGSEDAARDAVDARVLLAPVVRRLDERDRRILHLRFYEELTQSEIGERLGITQVQVCRLLTRIFHQARAEIGALEGTQRVSA